MCERYQINNSHRTLHGALLDTELLADVYLAMTRGQNNLMIEDEEIPRHNNLNGSPRGERPPLKVLRATETELDEHNRNLAGVQKESQGNCLWLKDSDLSRR